MGASIRVESLRKSFGPVRALDGIDLEFGHGLMHGLIGPDGAGKTTLLRHLTGLMRADGGTIHYFEGSAEQPFEKVRPRLAYMPQQQSLYPDLSVAEHLQFFRELYGLDDKEFLAKKAELLEVTRLGRFVDRPAANLSGGMYKKLGLMCALLASPSMLLLDEPTNGVDPISRREFWELLYRLREQDILIIVATAYMDEAERCTRVHLMDDGKVLASGEPRVLLRNAGVHTFDEFFLAREAAHE